MAFNGSGVWSYTYSWVNDAANGIPITASRMDAQFNDIGNNGFDNTLTRDGQGQPTANIPFAGYKITNLGPGTTGTDGVNVNQITAPTRQVLISGSAATYTTPTSPQAPRQLRIRMWGGGGGGGGSATSGGTDGGAGGDTIFNSIHAGGGQPDTGSGAQGGTSSTGTASLRLQGASGGISSSVIVSATTCLWQGGTGAGFGGGFGGGGAGTAGAANTGGGGGSGGIASAAFGTVSRLRAGGGAGEYVELIINSPTTSYTYTIGAGGSAGSAGSGGSNGAAGGSGLIIVDEFY